MCNERVTRWTTANCAVRARAVLLVEVEMRLPRNWWEFSDAALEVLRSQGAEVLQLIIKGGPPGGEELSAVVDYAGDPYSLVKALEEVWQKNSSSYPGE